MSLIVSPCRPSPQQSRGPAPLLAPHLSTVLLVMIQLGITFLKDSCASSQMLSEAGSTGDFKQFYSLYRQSQLSCFLINTKVNQNCKGH